MQHNKQSLEKRGSKDCMSGLLKKLKLIKAKGVNGNFRESRLDNLYSENIGNTTLTHTFKGMQCRHSKYLVFLEAEWSSKIIENKT